MATPTESANTLDALEQRIRDNADSHQPVETPLATSQRIIARVTDGIYREPWAAFRELIANAYDADATHVTIETGQPDFREVTVKDDGIGMSPRTLAYVLTNIGGSSKRTAAGTALNTARAETTHLSPAGRPLIGKIGIGLFAVAQLTQHFQIITKAAGESHRLSATVQLRTHDETKAQEHDTEYVAGLVEIVSQRVPDDERSSHGTTVVLYQLRDEVRRTLQSAELWKTASVETDGGESVQKPPQFHIGHSASNLAPRLPWQDSDSPTERFQQIFAATRKATGGTKSADLDHFDEYLRLIWKLSLSLPLRYIDRHPFDKDASSGLLLLELPESDQAREIKLAPAESLRNRLDLRTPCDTADIPFFVTLDGIELHRPIRLTDRLEKSSRVGQPVMIAAKQDNPFLPGILERAGGRLSFEAYLYWNSRIIPKETVGVLVRICGASGTLFDPTFLNYKVSEQTRLRQITAEIFVHEGLDSAVNIDRESFNYSHPHFLFIQKWLHRALRLLANRLKSLAASDLARAKVKLRGEALAYAAQVWARRLGSDADPPYSDPLDESLPAAVGAADVDWASKNILDSGGKPVGTGRIRALAAILEAYGVLSNLAAEDRCRLITDIVRLPETKS